LTKNVLHSLGEKIEKLETNFKNFALEAGKAKKAQRTTNKLKKIDCWADRQTDRLTN